MEIQWTEVHACEIIQLFSVVFWVVRDVLKYDFRLTDETLNIRQPLKRKSWSDRDSCFWVV